MQTGVTARYVGGPMHGRTEHLRCRTVACEMATRHWYGVWHSYKVTGVSRVGKDSWTARLSYTAPQPYDVWLHEQRMRWELGGWNEAQERMRWELKRRESVKWQAMAKNDSN